MTTEAARMPRWNVNFDAAIRSIDSITRAGKARRSSDNVVADHILSPDCNADWTTRVRALPGIPCDLSP